MALYYIHIYMFHVVVLDINALRVWRLHLYISVKYLKVSVSDTWNK